jgi:hypothetical protein
MPRVKTDSKPKKPLGATVPEKDRTAFTHVVRVSRTEANKIKYAFGDFIYFPDKGDHQNEGVYISDGENIVDLSGTYDVYGSLPSQFCILQNPDAPEGARKWYPRSYFVGATRDNIVRKDKKNKSWRTLQHNNYMWLSIKSYRKQLLANLVTKKGILTTTFQDTFDPTGAKELYVLNFPKKLSLTEVKSFLEQEDVMLVGADGDGSENVLGTTLECWIPSDSDSSDESDDDQFLDSEGYLIVEFAK